MKHIKIVISLVALLSILGFAFYQAYSPTTPARAQEGGQVESSSATTGVPQLAQLPLLQNPPVPSPEQLRERAYFQQQGPKQIPALPEGTTAVARVDSILEPSTQTNVPSFENQAGNQTPLVPGTFTLFRNSNLGATIKSQTAYVAEPSVANSGNIVFETGNWYGAISVDGGQTFKYVDPYTLFPASYGGFCCDQIAIYDPARDVFIWYLQYVSSGAPGSGQNLFRIAVASPTSAAQGSWIFYDFSSPANTEWDYPDMCLSNDYLWITTNRGPFNASYVNDAWMFKFPLDPLSVGAGFGYGFVDLGANGLANFSLRCTRGAHETMYFGTHNSTSQIRILRWAENSNSIFWNDVNLSVTWNNSTHTCPGPDARDWCGFDDARIKAGWVSQGRIGFMWGASQGGGFAYPYVEAVRVKESDRTYLDRPIIWNSTFAFTYPAASPNARGDLGVALFFGGGSYYPSFALSIDDDYSRDAGYGPAPWELLGVVQSSQGPLFNRWGDYLSVQPFAPTSLAWIASGYSLQGCGSFSGCAESNYEIFGRSRDLPSVKKYYNPIFGTFLPLMVK